MNSYTKGPWLYRGKSDSVHTTCDTHPYGPYLFSFKEESEPNDADLALILSAPDLLEALIAANAELEMWRAGFPNYSDSEEVAVMIDKAISKATGESA